MVNPSFSPAYATLSDKPTAKAFMNWSGGKDSALALYKVLEEKIYTVDTLLTTINATFNRISMHGVRRELLKKQVEAIGIPLTTVELPENPGMDQYESLMQEKLSALKHNNNIVSIFGDISLEDLKQYREQQLCALGINALFPLWKKHPHELVEEFIDKGFRAVVVCVNEQYLHKDFCGRILDRDFIKDLPPNVDPCGENGEYHTFVFDGPIFKHPVPFLKGEIINKSYPAPANSDRECYRDQSLNNHSFYFCDLLPEI